MLGTKFEKTLEIISSIFISSLGIMFICCAAHLFYTGGDEPYSRERVGEYLEYMLIPIILTLISVGLGVVYNIVHSISVDTKVKHTSSYLLKTMTKKTSLEGADESVKADIMKERTYRKTTGGIFISLSAICYVVCCVYIVFFSSFTVENMTGDIMSAFSVALPFGLMGVLFNIPLLILNEQSSARELKLIRENKLTSSYKKEEVTKNSDGDMILSVARIIVVAISLLFILLGVLNGGMEDVLGKAIKICTECIGLG